MLTPQQVEQFEADGYLILDPCLEEGEVKALCHRVRQIAEAVGDIGEEKLLLIAALALLDELDEAKSATPAIAGADRAAAAIGDAAARIRALAERIEAGQ